MPPKYVTGLILHGTAGLWGLSSARAIILDEETSGKLQLLYIHASQAISSVVHFDYIGINPPFISQKKKKKKPASQGMAKIKSAEFSLWLFFQWIMCASFAIIQKCWAFNGFVGCYLWKLLDLWLEGKSKYAINDIHKCAVNNMCNCTWYPWMIYLLVSLRELSMCKSAPSTYFCIWHLPFCAEILYIIIYTRETSFLCRPADF